MHIQFFILIFISSSLFSQYLVLEQGWNLRGSISNITDLSKLKTACVDRKIYTYDNGWKTYPEGITAINKGQGFWIHSKDKRCKINTLKQDNPNINGKLALGNIDLDGVNREYRFYKPNNLKNDASLMFYFHGSSQIFTKNGDFDSLADGLFQGSNEAHIFNKLARADNMIIVYPLSTIKDYGNGTKNAGWNHAPETELLYFDKLVKYFSDTYPQLNNKKIYISGHSSGAIFSFRLAGERTDIIAGAGVTSGRFSLVRNGEIKKVDFLDDNKSIPLIAFHGVNDDRTIGMENNLDNWHKLENQGTLDSVEKEDVEIGQYSATKKTYKNGISNLELYLLKDTRHSIVWGEIMETMWSFLKAHTKK